MVTITELLAAADIGTRQTLSRWVGMGLLPPAEVSKHSSGRGRISRWHDWVPDHCKHIVALRDQGHSLEAIKKALGTDWKKEEKVWQLREATKKSASTKTNSVSLSKSTREQFASRVWSRVQGVLGSAAIDGGVLYDALIDRLENGGICELALEQAGNGYNVFLVYDGVEMFVVPDFALGQRLAMDSSDEGSFMVVPLSADLKSIAANADIAMPEQPTYLPCSKVLAVDGDIATELEFHLVGKSDVRVVRSHTSHAIPVETEGKRRNVLRKRKTETKAGKHGSKAK